MKTVEVFAPAKINLTLHVTGRRADGYHLLDSLVVFGDIGDRIAVSPAARTRLALAGPMAGGVPADRRNLVFGAAELMGVEAEIRLEKHLPAAAGLGGGSADAAATLRALSQMTANPLPGPGALGTLGADVALCMLDGLVRMRGIGERLERLGPAPALSMILVNPGVPMPTGAVFQALARRDLPAMEPPMPDPGEPAWVGWLAHQRNDLEEAASALAPVIGRVLAVLRADRDCLLARMSGSGATCFAIMRDDGARDAALARLKATHPDWWIRAANPVH